MLLPGSLLPLCTEADGPSSPSCREVKAGTCVTDVSTLLDRGLSPEALLARSCCSTGSPGGKGLGGGTSSAPVSTQMRNMLRRKWWLSSVAVGANGMGWKGRVARSAWQARAIGGPHGEGGPLTQPGLTLPCLPGPICSGWAEEPQGAWEPWQPGSLVGTLGQPGPTLQGGPQARHVHSVLGVHRSTALPAEGWAVFMAGRRPVGQDSAAPLTCLVPGSLLAHWPLDIFPPLKSYLRTFGSLAIFTY